VTTNINHENPLDLSPKPKPLPTALPDVDEFDLALLPDQLHGWVDDIADRMQCPLDFPGVAGLLALSTLVGRRAVIFPKQYDNWQVVPNLWGAIIGRPGLMKTPAIGEAKRMLDRLEIEAKEVHEAEMMEYEARQKVAKVAGKEADRRIAKAIKNKDDAHLIALDAVKGGTEEPPGRIRYLTNDTTVEKLGEILADNPDGVMVYRDELVGLLTSLDREDRAGARQFFLEAWNGDQRFSYDRIGRGTIDIESACITVFGGIQPGPLRNYMASASKGGSGDDGLIQRFQLLVWPDVKGDWINVDRMPNTAARDRVWHLFNRINQIDRRDGLRFDPEAQEVFNEWRTSLEERLRGDSLSPVLEAHFAKYRSLIPSLALLSHLVDDPDGETVSVLHLTRALAWSEYLDSHAKRVYSQQLAPDMAAAIELSAHIQQGDLQSPFSERDVYRNHWRGLDREATRQAVRVLVDYDHLINLDVDTGGRPTTIYQINPHLRVGR